MARKPAASTAGPALFEADPPPASDAGGAPPAEPAALPDLALYVTRLRVRGYAGFEAEETFDFGPGVNLITGPNGSRKSSILAALRCVLGIDRVSAMRRANIHRDPAVVPEIEVTLRNVDASREAVVLRAGDGGPEVRLRTGDQWSKPPRPADWLRELVGSGAAPEAFLLAGPDDRATMLLEALDLPGYSRAEALQRAGIPGFALPPIPDGLHPLEDLEHVHKAIFGSRTIVNGERRAEEDAAAKLLEGLPAQPPADAAGSVAALEGETERLALDVAKAEAEADAAERARLAEAKGAHAAAVAAVGVRVDQEWARVEAAHEARAAEIRAEAERQIAALAEGVKSAVAELLAGRDRANQAAAETLAAAEAEARAAREQARAEHEADRASLAAARERLAALREAQKAADLDRRTREAAQAAKAKAAAHAERAEVLTRALDLFRRYATELAGTMPIKGLTVSFDDKGRRVVALEGLPLEQVNDGRLAELADEVSLMRNATAGTDRLRLPIILIDWAEKVDETRREAHLRGLAERGAQVFAAVVTGEPGPAKVRRAA